MYTRESNLGCCTQSPGITAFYCGSVARSALRYVPLQRDGGDYSGSVMGWSYVNITGMAQGLVLVIRR